MNHKKIYTILLSLVMLFAGCAQVQNENINTEIIDDQKEDSNAEIVDDQNASINAEIADDQKENTSTEILGYIVFADLEKITVDEKTWISKHDEEWKEEYSSKYKNGFVILDNSEMNVTYPVAEGCPVFLLDKRLRQELEEYSYASVYEEIIVEKVPLFLFDITIQDGEVVSLREVYVP